MASRIVHFGLDECYRLAVLSKAGYHLQASGTSIFSLARLLLKEAPDAIAISEDDWECDSEAISLSRSLSSAPIVLFEGINRRSELPTVDLAVRLLTPPSEWLDEIARAIQRSKEMRAESKSIQEQAAELHNNAHSASARLYAAEELVRAKAKSIKKG